MLQKHELPRGDEWKDLLASRSIREVVIAYLARRLEQWFLSEGGSARLGRLIIHNGKDADPVILADGQRVSAEDAPRAGEADLALVMWSAWLQKRTPGGARTVIRTIDTDILAIASLHEVGHCVISFTHHDAKHRLCVSVDAFRSELMGVYKLRPPTFVALAIAKGCDFAEPTLAGIPDWHDTLRLCGPSAERRKLFDEASKLDFGELLGALRTGVMSHKRAKVARSDPKHKETVVFAVTYWMQLGAAA